VEITGRSWDPKAAGRRAVEKHGDALKRLSDEQGSAACPACGRVMRAGSLCYGAPGQPEHEAAHATNAPKETR
jgi:hypothetical protein